MPRNAGSTGGFANEDLEWRNAVASNGDPIGIERMQRVPCRRRWLTRRAAAAHRDRAAVDVCDRAVVEPNLLRKVGDMLAARRRAADDNGDRRERA